MYAAHAALGPQDLWIGAVPYLTRNALVAARITRVVNCTSDQNIPDRLLPEGCQATMHAYKHRSQRSSSGSSSSGGSKQQQQL